LDWSAIAQAGLTPPQIASEATGQGVRVAVVDTGVDFDHVHLGLEPRGAAVRWAGDDLVVDPGAAPDVFGHGTCCAALIHWLAPGAELYAVRVTDERPTTDAARLALGIRHAVDAGAAVLAVAMGTKTSDRAGLDAAVVWALEQGAVVVAPDPGEPVLPGICPGAMRVGYWDGVDVVRDGPGYLAEGRARPARGRARNFKGPSMSTARAAAALARYLEGTAARGTAALEAFSNQLGVR
jgi:hypothetical protein